MNQTQCQAVAAGFIHALKHSPDARDEWVEVAGRSDWPALRALIGKTLALADVPTEADLAAMSAHAADHLIPERQALAGSDERMLPQLLFNGLEPPHI